MVIMVHTNKASMSIYLPSHYIGFHIQPLSCLSFLMLSGGAQPLHGGSSGGAHVEQTTNSTNNYCQHRRPQTWSQTDKRSLKSVPRWGRISTEHAIVPSPLSSLNVHLTLLCPFWLTVRPIMVTDVTSRHQECLSICLSGCQAGLIFCRSLLHVYIVCIFNVCTSLSTRNRWASFFFSRHVHERLWYDIAWYWGIRDRMLASVSTLAALSCL